MWYKLINGVKLFYSGPLWIYTKMFAFQTYPLFAVSVKIVNFFAHLLVFFVLTSHKFFRRAGGGSRLYIKYQKQIYLFQI